MFFTASKIFALMFTPSNFIALLLIASASLMLTGAFDRLARRLFLIGVALFALCGFSPLGAWITMPLEERFQRQAATGKVTGIILLGGYEDPGMWQARGLLTVNESAERLLETMALARQHPDAKIIVTGAWATLLPNTVDATAPVVDYMVTMGLSRDRIIAETKSRNTHENAVLSLPLVGPTKDQRFLLVTSAYHMPRAMGVFRMAGFTVAAWPVDYRTQGLAEGAIPFRWAVQGLARVDLASKEWIGLLAYWLTGRTDSLLPAP